MQGPGVDSRSWLELAGKRATEEQRQGTLLATPILGEGNLAKDFPLFVYTAGRTARLAICEIIL